MEEPHTYDAPDPDFPIISLDLLSALAEALCGTPEVKSLVGKLEIMDILTKYVLLTSHCIAVL